MIFYRFKLVRYVFVSSPYEKNSGECIGQIAFFSVDTTNRQGEIEYVIGPAFQGKGFATEMTKAVIKFGFEEINFHRIEIDCRTVNEASKKVIEKCGLTYEGTFRDSFGEKIITKEDKCCTLC